MQIMPWEEEMRELLDELQKLTPLRDFLKTQTVKTWAVQAERSEAFHGPDKSTR